MGFVSAANPIWPVTPDWTNGVNEMLVWGTDVTHANATAVSQHRSYRTLPRRSFGFSILAESQERRVAEMLLSGHGGRWQLPIWPDVQTLGATLSSASSTIPCETAGFDFAEGGKALLYTAVNTWEEVTIDTVESDHLVLVDPTEATFDPSSRLYPLRSAEVGGGSAEWISRSGNVGRFNLLFNIAEPCRWPILEGLTTYLGHPVLDVRPDHNGEAAAGNTRLLQVVDYGTSNPVVHDLPDVGLRTQQADWKLFGRAEHTWFRSLLYTLKGRKSPIWVPSWNDDLELAATISGNSDELTVEWVGYTLFGEAKVNRTDLRIELRDGTVYYRRIESSFDNGATEILTLDSALSSSDISAQSIRGISFMALCTLASDGVEIQHLTDASGTATATTGWQAVVPDV